MRRAALVYLDNLCKGKTYSLMRRHYTSPICLPLCIFRFMVEHRGLVGYSILHVIHYAEKDFLRPWLMRLLQERWDLRGCTDDPGAVLTRDNDKLTANGCVFSQSSTKSSFPAY